MKISQLRLNSNDFSFEQLTSLHQLQPQLITAFGPPQFFSSLNLGQKLKSHFPSCHIIGCSTPHSDSLILSAVNFKRPILKSTMVPFRAHHDCVHAGQKIGLNLKSPDLTGIFLLGQGEKANGANLLSGLKNKVAKEVVISGGLAKSDGLSSPTYVLLNEIVSSEIIAAFGIYGKALQLVLGNQPSPSEICAEICPPGMIDDCQSNEQIQSPTRISEAA